MARITKVQKAQKDQGVCRRAGCKVEIRTGDSYYWFANLIGRTSIRKIFCSSHFPRSSETTTSDKLSQAYAAQESLSDAIGSASCLDDITGALNEAAEQANDVAQQYRDSIDNMPENLQNGSQADEMNEKADNLEQWAQTLEDAAGEIEGMDSNEDDEDECASCGHTRSLHQEEACKGLVHNPESSRDDPCDCMAFEDQNDPLEDARNTASTACEELSI